jgi:hypothetical protein
MAFHAALELSVTMVGRSRAGDEVEGSGVEDGHVGCVRFNYKIPNDSFKEKRA